MRNFFQLLLAATIIYFAAIAFRTPVYIKRKTVVRSSPNTIVLQRNEEFLNFTIFFESAIRASIFRIRSLQRAIGASNVRGISFSGSHNFVLGHLAAARASLRAVQAFPGSSLGKMVLVKYDLIALLKIEIRIWGSLLSSTDMPILAAGNPSYQFDLNLHAFSLASTNLSNTYLRILNSTNT